MIIGGPGHRYGWREAQIFPLEFFAAPPPAGTIKIWDGASFVAHPIKVWMGASWQVKPLRWWDGIGWS